MERIYSRRRHLEKKKKFGKCPGVSGRIQEKVWEEQ